MASQCLISFGSNLGRRRRLLAEAARAVKHSELVSEFHASRLFETPPVGGPGGQAAFLNAVAAFQTEASAGQVLAVLQQTERMLGRMRQRRWDARSVDLDVVLHGDLVGGAGNLVVPHPRYPARRFVLVPACDVAGHYRDPRFDWTIAQLREHIEQAVPSMVLLGDDQEVRREILRRLAERHGVQTMSADKPSATVSTIANVPLPATPLPIAPSGTAGPSDAIGQAVGRSEGEQPVTRGPASLDPTLPWVCDHLPMSIPGERHDQSATIEGNAFGLKEIWRPRLIARLQRVTADTAWPAPHQMWPKGWRYPEYRLEIDDLDWAVDELASALISMRCECVPVSEDGAWWC